MKVAWKVIEFDERYKISNTGKVMRSDNGRIRKPSVAKNGYHLCVFSNPGGKHTAHYIHRLVAHHFICPCPDAKEVSHLDGDRSNNCVNNLVYESHCENIRRKAEHGTENTGERNGSAKVNVKQVQEIIDMRKSGRLLREIADIYGISFQQVSRICKKDNWRERHKGGEESLRKGQLVSRENV